MLIVKGRLVFLVTHVRFQSFTDYVQCFIHCDCFCSETVQLLLQQRLLLARQRACTLRRAGDLLCSSHYCVFLKCT